MEKQEFEKLNLDDLFGDTTPKEENEKVADNKQTVTEEKASVKDKKATTDKKSDNKTKTAKKEKKEVKYKFPFQIYLAGNMLEVSHIFEENQEYTAEEISKKMLEHRFYEFSGKTTYDYIKDDNVLVPTFQQHKKG